MVNPDAEADGCVLLTLALGRPVAAVDLSGDWYRHKSAALVPRTESCGTPARSTPGSVRVRFKADREADGRQPERREGMLRVILGVAVALMGAAFGAFGGVKLGSWL